MTDIELIEEKLKTNDSIIDWLTSRLAHYRQREGELIMELNRARRLEREAKELQDDTHR